MAALGRRIDIETVSVSAAGGTTICTRSPSGSMADRMGFCGPISCSVYVAMALASDKHRASVRCGASTRRHSGPFSRNTSPGRLMTTSVTPSSVRKVRSGRMSSRTIASRARYSIWSGTSAGAQRIYGTEVEIAGDVDGAAIALVLVQRRLDVDGALEHFLGHVVAGLRGVLV